MLIGSSNCSSRRQLGDAFCFGVTAAGENVGKAQAAGLACLAEDHDRAQRRQARRFEFSGRRAGKLGRELAQHADIVRGLEALGEDQRLAADLVERVFELGDPIGRIDVDQNEPGLGGGELGEHPLAVVGRPDADAVAGIAARASTARRRAGRRPPATRRSSCARSGGARRARAGPPIWRTRHRRTARSCRRGAACRSPHGRSSA